MVVSQPAVVELKPHKLQAFFVGGAEISCYVEVRAKVKQARLEGHRSPWVGNMSTRLYPALGCKSLSVGVLPLVFEGVVCTLPRRFSAVLS